VKFKKSIAFAAVAGLAVALVALAGCSNGSTSTTSGGSSGGFTGTAVVGAGSSFAQPFYALWAQDFVKVEPDAKVNYQPIGSGGGIQQFTAKTVDFGATDVPLKASEASAIKGDYIEFPTALGAVVVAYNVPGVTTPLKLDGPTTAKIFLGTIKKWNDPAIVAQNPGVTLPDTAIQIVHRADASGTSGIFTGWLAMESPDWKSKVGAGKSVQWPSGQGANGNAGVAQAMSQTKGSIGYLESQYAVTTQLGVASLKAPDGTYVAASADGVAKAGQDLAFPITETTTILDSKVAGAYPMASATYILMYKDISDQKKAQTLVDFWTWSLTKGQDELGKLNYVPLPSSVAQGALSLLGEVTSGGTAVKASAGVQ